MNTYSGVVTTVNILSPDREVLVTLERAADSIVVPREGEIVDIHGKEFVVRGLTWIFTSRGITIEVQL